MQDIGIHPDTRSMHPDLKNYETERGEGDECPFCGEIVDDIYDTQLEGLLQSAIEQGITDSVCLNCGAKLKISYILVPLAFDSYSARVEFEIEATKKVA